MTDRYTLNDLLYLMQRLRTPDSGCPWDLQQDEQSLLPYLLEEVYEVVAAVEQQQPVELKEELGDLLLQIVFYAQLADEQQQFCVHDVIDTLVTKLIRRHPHVFAKGQLYAPPIPAGSLDSEQVSQQWQRIKQQEQSAKQGTAQTDLPLLAQVPAAIPALARSYHLQQQAAQVGFDWPDLQGVFDKLDEELQEVKQALVQADAQAIEEELGDALFALVNLARKAQVDPETALRRANQKFTQRFAQMETQAAQAGQPLAQHSAQQWQQRWLAAKTAVADTAID